RKLAAVAAQVLFKLRRCDAAKVLQFLADPPGGRQTRCPLPFESRRLLRADALDDGRDGLWCRHADAIARRQLGFWYFARSSRRRYIPYSGNVGSGPADAAVWLHLVGQRSSRSMGRAQCLRGGLGVSVWNPNDVASANVVGVANLGVQRQQFVHRRVEPLGKCAQRVPALDFVLHGELPRHLDGLHYLPRAFDHARDLFRYLDGLPYTLGDEPWRYFRAADPVDVARL